MEEQNDSLKRALAENMRLKKEIKALKHEIETLKNFIGGIVL